MTGVVTEKADAAALNAETGPVTAMGATAVTGPIVAPGAIVGR
jgi:hypothetical protein